jgi:hypothetical protein
MRSCDPSRPNNSSQPKPVEEAPERSNHREEQDQIPEGGEICEEFHAKQHG